MNTPLFSRHARRLLVAGYAVLGVQSLAQADLRCGTALVSEGASTYAVQKKCGPPVHREVIPAALAADGARRAQAATIEHWVYGPRNGATYQLKFIDGTLVSIDLSR